MKTHRFTQFVLTAAAAFALAIPSHAAVTAGGTIGDSALLQATANAGETLTQGAGVSADGPDLIHDFDTTALDGSYNFLNGTDVALSSGLHLVLYNSQFNDSVGSNRTEVVSQLNLAGSDLAIGHSQSFTRDASGNNEAVTTGGAIIKVANDDDVLQLQTFRSDANASQTVTRINNTTGLQLVKLDDSWDYLSLEKTADSGQLTTNEAYQAVSYDGTTHVITGSSMSWTSGGDITLNNTGLYLIFANTWVEKNAQADGTRCSIRQRLTLAGSTVPATTTTSYIRGSANGEGVNTGIAAIGTIIENTVGGSTLNVQVARQTGSNTLNIKGSRTGITIVKLPDSAEWLDVRDLGVNSQEMRTTGAIVTTTFPTEVAEDPPFDNSTTTGLITINTADQYLFLGSFFCDENAPGPNVINTADRVVPQIGWQLNGTGGMRVYGRGSEYNRDEGGNQANGSFAGAVFDLAVNDTVEMVHNNIGQQGVAKTLPSDELAVRALRLGSVFPSTDPVVTTNGVVGLSIGDPPATIDDTFLFTTDIDDSANALTYTIDTTVSGGVIKLNGSIIGDGTTSGGTFTQQDLIDDLLTFEPGGVEVDPGGFDFTVADDDGGPTDSGTFVIRVIQVIVIGNETTASTDENGTLSESDITPAQADLFTNDTGNTISLLSADTASANGAGVTVNSDGTFLYDASKSLAAQMLGSGDSIANDTFTYTLIDVIGKTASGTVTIPSITGVEDGIGGATDDDGGSVGETGVLVNTTLDVLANDGLITENQGNELILNYEATGDDGGTRWENTGSQGGTDMDFVLTGVTQVSATSSHAKIASAFEWDTTDVATFDVGAVSIGLGASVDTNDATWEFWVKPDASFATNNMTIFETGGGTGWGMVIDNGEIKAGTEEDGRTMTQSYVSYDLLLDPLDVVPGAAGAAAVSADFVQIAAAIDIGGGGIALYVNGIKVDESLAGTGTDWDGGDFNGLGRFQGANHSGFQGGAAGTYYDAQFLGQMAIVRCYGGLLTSDEVLSNYKFINQAGLVDVEGDAIAVHGIYDNGPVSTLTTGTGTEVTLASGAKVTLDSTTGNFTYDPNGIYNSLLAGETATDSFTYALTDAGSAGGQLATAEVNITITGANTAVDDGTVASTTDPLNLQATEGILNVFRPNQIVGNDDHEIGSANPIIRLNAGEYTPGEFQYMFYDAETAGFTVGQTLTGATTGATATIAGISDEGATGTMRLSSVTGSFANNEIINGDIDGSAMVNTVPQSAWVNRGTGGAKFDITLDSGTFLTAASGAVSSGFAGIEAAFEDIDGRYETLTDFSTADATLEIWFKPDFTGVGKQLLLETGGSGTGMSLAYDNSTGVVTFKIDGGTDTNPDQQLEVQATGITPNEFNQLVAIYDRDNPGSIDSLTLYVNNNPVSFNGTPNATSSTSPTGVNNFSGGDNSGLGAVNASVALNEGGFSPFDGQVAIVRMYPRQLSMAEIETNFDAVVQPITKVQAVSQGALGVDGPAQATTTLAGATVRRLANGNIEYDATALSSDIPLGAKVADSFTYSTSDGAGGETTATVAVTVTGIAAYLAVDDSFSIGEDGPAGDFDVTANDIGYTPGTTTLEIESAVSSFSAIPDGTVHGETADFTTGGVGWQLFWSAPVGWVDNTTAGWSGTTGGLGTAADYQSLVWDSTVNGWMVDADGLSNGAFDEPGSFLRISTDGGGHPGAGSGNAVGVGNTQERCAILAYTVAEAGLYGINNSNLQKTSGSGSGLTIEVYVNDTFQSSTSIPSGNVATNFDQILPATLAANDTIYVAICPDGDRGSDTFNSLDLDIVKIPSGDYQLLNVQGTVTVNGDQLNFDPAGGYDSLGVGASLFETVSYVINDPVEGLSTATLTVEIIGVNDNPVAVADNGGTTDEDTILNGASVLGNDTDVDLGDILGVTVAEVQGSAGNVGVSTATNMGGSVTVQADGTFSYDPGAAFDYLSLGDADATDSFSYKNKDTNGGTSVAAAVVSLTITPVDSGVFANPNSYTVDADLVLSGNVITDDTGSGPDVSVDANDILAVSGKDEDGLALDGVLSLEAGALVGTRGGDIATTTVTTINFGTTFASTPVVIASPPTFNETEPTIVRVTNVTTSSFDVQLVEQPEGGAAGDGDGAVHLTESFSWIAMLPGQYQLANGALMEVGSLDTQATAGTFATVNYATAFGSTPVVLSFLQTANQHPGELFGTRMRNLGAASFQVALERYQSSPATARTLNETIGWIAIDDNQTGAWSGNLFETDRTGNSVVDTAFTINFDWNYGSAPDFIASQATYNGPDPAQLRMENLDQDSVQVRVREDTHGDGEIGHAAESVTYLAIGGSGTLEAYPQGTVNGAFSYDPAGAFTGLTTTTTRTFDYTVTDSLGNVDATTVTITIKGDSLMRNWRNAFFGPGGTATSGPDNTGDGADSNDHDSASGNVNVLEFGFGGDPTNAADDGTGLTIDATTWTLGNPIMTLNFSPLQIKILYPRVMESDGVTPYPDLGYTPQFDFDDGVAGFNFEPDPNRIAATRVQKDGGGDMPVLDAPGLASGVAMKYALYQEIVPLFHPVTGLKLEQLLGRVEVLRGVNAANSGQVGP